MKKVLIGIFLGLFLISFVSAVCPAGCPEGMASYWKLEETEIGTYADECNINNLLHYDGGYKRGIDGKVGDSFLFTGDGQAIKLPWTVDDYHFTDAGSENYDFSIVSWVKLDSSINNHAFLALGPDDIGREHLVHSSTTGWNFQTVFEGGINCNDEIHSQSDNHRLVEGSVNTPYNKWAFIVVTSERTNNVRTWKLYINGEFVKEQTGVIGGEHLETLMDGQWYSCKDYMLIGRVNNVGNLMHYRGGIDELAFFNDDLSQTEVKALYDKVEYGETDYCGPNWVSEYCGNKIVEEGEDCDDGNENNDDKCYSKGHEYEC